MGCIDKADCASKLGLKSISGIRPPESATGGSKVSLHAFGLAVDINAKQNPFVGLTKHKVTKDRLRPPVIKRATFLVQGKEFNIVAPKPKGKDTGEWWETLHGVSEALKAYFALADDVDELKKKVDARRADGDTRSVSDWKTQIAQDHKLFYEIDVGDFKKRTAEMGIMDLKKELVVALVDKAGLTWGGKYNEAKDFMHFDWRKGTIKGR